MERTEQENTPMMQDSEIVSIKNEEQFMSVESADEIKSKQAKSENKSMEDDEEDNKEIEPYKSSTGFTESTNKNSETNSETIYFHSFKVFKKLFIVPKKYVIEKAVGKGSYGIVCKALNIENNEEVAIK